MIKEGLQPPIQREEFSKVVPHVGAKKEGPSCLASWARAVR
ncbi:hypothetical protein HanIR_Chr03g0125481 [Helianthus annuus]|nr:hypothetical protein HanIR_Chr03g0125481 [Helianthus annuus]